MTFNLHPLASHPWTLSLPCQLSLCPLLTQLSSTLGSFPSAVFPSPPSSTCSFFAGFFLTNTEDACLVCWVNGDKFRNMGASVWETSGDRTKEDRAIMAHFLIRQQGSSRTMEQRKLWHNCC